MNSSKIPNQIRPILTILADGAWHSGPEIGQKRGLTRAAIWKILQQFSTLGIEIQTSRRQGYRLVDTIELLEAQKINDYLQPTVKQQLKKLAIFDSLDSTNQYLLDQAKQGAVVSQVCLAEHQTAGRGRRGRPWFSPFGTNLYLSVLWHFTQDPAELGGLSLAVAVAIVRALQHYGVSGLQLKWPNDIWWSGHKLVGILLEMYAEKHTQCNVIIGIGINLAAPRHAAPIDQPWTSLEKVMGQKPARNQLTAYVLNALFPALNEFSVHGLEPFMAEWQQHDIALGRKITLLLPTRQLTGICRGIRPDGAILLEDEQHQLHAFLSGEVSLRLANSRV